MEKVLYTIGHSIYPLEDFFALLAEHEIQVVVDVRSRPYSRYATHFHGPFLKIALHNAGLKYLFLGNELGGKPEAAEFYDQEGHVRYDWVSQSEPFQNGIKRLLTGMEKYRIAIMCGEEDPTGCHRRLLIGPAMAEQNVKLLHIRKGGKLQSNEDLVSEDERIKSQNTQLTLFSVPANEPWRSAKAIARTEPEL